jgi:hypothetical protein
MVELSFLCTALLLNMIYRPMIWGFKLIPQILFEICSGQKCRTEGRTDGRKIRRTDGDYFYIPRRLSARDNKHRFNLWVTLYKRNILPSTPHYVTLLRNKQSPQPSIHHKKPQETLFALLNVVVELSHTIYFRTFKRSVITVQLKQFLHFPFCHREWKIYILRSFIASRYKSS